jgi:hypothetical protein
MAAAMRSRSVMNSPGLRLRGREGERDAHDGADLQAEAALAVGGQADRLADGPAEAEPRKMMKKTEEVGSRKAQMAPTRGR